MKKRFVKRCEALAILADSLHSDSKAIWWDFAIAVPANERHGNVAVVNIRGSLEHHKGIGHDSYEEILERAREAFSGGDDDSEPSAVVLRIDSPGGVVSGLNETVYALRRLSAESGIPLIAYVDELAASAAYALACSCDEIYLPASAIAGSVGVISCLYDQTKADADMGLRFVTLTSGARKADGHPHVAISDAAVSAEQRRVDRLAKQFFRIVAKARPIDVEAIEALQAGIFVGKEAVSKGLADAVLGWDDLIETLNDEPAGKKSLAKVAQSEPSSAVRGTTSAKGKTETPHMLTALQAMVKKAATALNAETDPKKRVALAEALAAHTASLEAYKKTKHSVEKYETEESEEEEAEEESSEESEEEAKGNETERKEKKAESDDDDGDEDGEDKDAEDEEEEDEEESEEASAKKMARAALAGGAAGRRALGKLSALITKAHKFDALNGRIAKLERDARDKQKSALIAEAVASRRITRSMAKQLNGKPIDFVKGTLEMHKAPLVNIDEDSLHVPDGKPNGDLSAKVIKSIDTTVTASGFRGEAAEKLREKLITAHREAAAKANGGETF